MNRRLLLRRIQVGQTNVRFSDFQYLVEGFGFFEHRARGSHHIYKHRKLPLRLNLQSRGGDAKPYQIREFLDLVEAHKLRLEADE